MPATLETERLTLQPMTSADVADLHTIYQDDRAMRFMPNPPYENVQQTQQLIEQQLGGNGAAYWSIRLKDSTTVIGQVNYLGQTRIPGMGYILHPYYWGQGIAVEACRAALDYGFAHFNYDRVELWIDERNSASLRVAQKLGFQVKGRIAHKYHHETSHHFMLVWGMLAHEWRTHPTHNPPVTPRFFSVEPVLMVHDVAATVAYYGDKLGFNVDFVVGDPPDHAGVSRGEWTGSLVSLQVTRVPPERELTPSGYLHIRMDEGLDALYEQYRSNGIEIFAEPDDKPWGFREFAIKDLNGHVLVFATHL